MTWLSRRLGRLDRGYLVVGAICLLAIWPFISRQALPQATDAELHIFRLAELSRVVHGGELYPRWAPNFYYGLGYPIFNYYAPLTYYLGLVLDFLPLVGPVLATKALFVLGFLGAGTGIYALVRDLWGRGPGLVASAAYVYAPYIQFVDPHARGDLAEFLSFAILPWALWAYYRLARRASTVWWMVAVGLTAAAILTHNLMAMVTFGLLLAWSAWQTAAGTVVTQSKSQTGPARWMVSGRLFWALLLGAGMAAFFWLVVGLEQDAVNLATLVGEGGHFDFRNHFLSLAELLAPSQRLDWGASEPGYRLNLGLIQWLLALVGAGLLVAGRVQRPRQGAFFLAVSFGLLLMMLPVSTYVWEGLPLLPYLQFPWRLLGPVAATNAVLAGVATSALAGLMSAGWAKWLPAGLIGLVLLFALPLTQVPPWPEDFGPTDAYRVLQEELAGRWLGTTSTADFVPATVDVLSRPVPDLVGDYRDGLPVDRVNWATVPEEATVVYEQATPLHFRYQTSHSQPFLLRLFLHQFPGWTAYVDGNHTDIEIGRPEGFVVVPVPAGVHVVEVVFESTPERTIAAAVSLASLLATLGVGIWLWRLPAVHPPVDESTPVIARPLRPVLLVVLVCTGLYVALANPAGWLRHYSTGLEVEPARRKTLAIFEEQIALLGYDFDHEAVSPGGSLALTLYWKALAQPSSNYQVFVHVLDEQGRLVAQSDKLNPGDFPSKRWPLDKYVRDRHRLVFPAELPDGEYVIRVGLWFAAEGTRLTVSDESGVVLGDGFPLPEPLTVE